MAHRNRKPDSQAAESAPSADSDALFHQLFEFAPDAILVVGTNGRIQAMNRRASVCFGYSPEELVGAAIEVLVPAEARSRHVGLRDGFLEAPEERRMGVGFDVWAERKDGSRLPVEIALLPLNAGNEVRILALVRDLSERHLAHIALSEAHAQLERRVVERTRELTEANQRLHEEIRERERAESQLRAEQQRSLQTEKMSSIGLLSSGIAHEINNPLSGVLGCIKALKDGQVAEDRQQEYLETIEDGLHRIAGTVRGLLDYARQRAPAPASVDVSEVVAAALRLIEPTAGKRGVDLRTSGMTEPVWVWADRAQLMQAIVNVVMNAIQATPAGRWVRLSVLESERPGHVGLQVSDCGPGFAPDEIHRVCDPFFTTKPEGEGTGLGLAVTVGIIHAHGGELELANDEAGGARVTLWLKRESAGHET